MLQFTICSHTAHFSMMENLLLMAMKGVVSVGYFTVSRKAMLWSQGKKRLTNLEKTTLFVANILFLIGLFKDELSPLSSDKGQWEMGAFS